MSEWDEESKKNVFWEKEVVFASKDPDTGKNRKAWIRVEEGLHDGYLEILLRTPANTLNLKIRPAMGFIEAYHDNKVAVFGETNMNYRANAYMGYTDEIKKAVEEAEIKVKIKMPSVEDIMKMLAKLNDAEEHVDKHLDNLNEFTESFIDEEFGELESDPEDWKDHVQDFKSFIEDVRQDQPMDRTVDMTTPTSPKLPAECLNSGDTIVNLKTSEVLHVIDIELNDESLLVIKGVSRTNSSKFEVVLNEDDYLIDHLKISI